MLGVNGNFVYKSTQNSKTVSVNLEFEIHVLVFVFLVQ